ncbi:MAG: hypothetical protein E6G48_05445 [Actinobacteria bacterium]|nr:MAG: hypothetical protein E6G48_05445 [Actinomycetota bacterium]
MERPLEHGGRARRLAPFVIVAVAAFVAVLIVSTRSKDGQVIAAGLLVPPLIASVLRHRRAPA